MAVPPERSSEIKTPLDKTKQSPTHEQRMLEYELDKIKTQLWSSTIKEALNKVTPEQIANFERIRHRATEMVRTHHLEDTLPRNEILSMGLSDLLSTEELTHIGIVYDSQKSGRMSYKEAIAIQAKHLLKKKEKEKKETPSDISITSDSSDKIEAHKKYWERFMELRIDFHAIVDPMIMDILQPTIDAVKADEQKHPDKYLPGIRPGLRTRK